MMPREVERCSRRVGLWLLPSSWPWLRQCLRILGCSWCRGETYGLAWLERGPGVTHKREYFSINKLKDAKDKKVKSQSWQRKIKGSRSVIDSWGLGVSDPDMKAQGMSALGSWWEDQRKGIWKILHPCCALWQPGGVGGRREAQEGRGIRVPVWFMLIYGRNQLNIWLG